MQSTAPEDFGVVYEWREGSLPPPYHYEYRISLRSSGQGEVTLTPDYSSPEVPVWKESFAVHPSVVDELYDLIVSQDLLKTDLKAPLQTAPSVGGSLESMLITADGKETRIPQSGVAQQSSPLKKTYVAVKELVPETVWRRLNILRGKYFQEYRR